MTSTEQVVETTDKRDERETTPKAEEPVVSATPKPVTDDEDSEWEDLDEVLDDFSGPKRSTEPAASSKPSDTQNNAAEEAFIKQLEADMLAQLIGGEASGKGKAPAPAPGTTKGNTEEPSLPNLIKMLQGMSEEDAAKFEEDMKKDGGMQNLFKNLLDSEGTGAGSSASAGPAGVAGESFPDTIQKTLERMQESGEKITIEAKTSQDKLIDASISRLMEMAEAAGNGGNLDLEQVFSDVIKEMSNKEMLYEPMKEYDAKYGPWLEENKPTLSAEDYANYEKQAGVIKKIVETFESKDYSDDKPECLASIWELMQQMEACGPPPSDLIKGSMGDGVLPSLVPFIDDTPASGNLEDIDPGQIPPECNPQ
ncbi:hypothetical protein ZTR_00149 [Talaromyces verruculosus]|nr:hypothetical protein ZTR_00149 [Talaromyces verruculosus]